MECGHALVGVWSCTLSGDRQSEADHLVSCLPSHDPFNASHTYIRRI